MTTDLDQLLIEPTTPEEMGMTPDEIIFANRVRGILTDIGDMLIEKNRAYGNAALDPVRMFSKASSREQILVRIDDKLSRIQRGNEFPGDDTIKDLMGYLVLLRMAD